MSEMTKRSAMPKTGAELIETLQGTTALDRQFQDKLLAALPESAGVSKQRFLSIAVNLLKSNPKLRSCTPFSLVTGIYNCASMGLDPSLQHCWLIPYKIAGNETAQLQIGYTGYLDLMYRSGKVLDVRCEVVWTNDEFEYVGGRDVVLRHRPYWVLDRTAPGERRAVYVVFELEGGAQHCAAMSWKEVEQHRDRSMAYKMSVKYNKKDTPWLTDPDAMAKKTIIKAERRFLPATTELRRAVVVDDQADAGLEQDSLEIPNTPIEKPNPNDATDEMDAILDGHSEEDYQRTLAENS